MPTEIEHMSPSGAKIIVFGHFRDLAEAIAEGRLAIEDVELAADIVVGIWLQVARGTLERRGAPDLTRQALHAALRALGVPRCTGAAGRGRASRRCKSPNGHSERAS